MKIKVTLRVDSKYGLREYLEVELVEEDVVALAIEKAKDRYCENACCTFTHSSSEVTSA